MPPHNPDQARWFAEQVQPHEPALRAYLRNRFPTLQDVDDLVQETYARLFRARDGGPVEHARAYLFTIARNAAHDLFRRNKIVSIEPLAENNASSVLADGPDAAETASHDQEIDILLEAIAALPERCREILRLRKIDGLSHREIAQRLGIAERTVNSQLAIGVLRCREFLRTRGVLKARAHDIERS